MPLSHLSGMILTLTINQNFMTVSFQVFIRIRWYTNEKEVVFFTKKCIENGYYVNIKNIYELKKIKVFQECISTVGRFDDG